jgi:hypothetical protein
MSIRCDAQCFRSRRYTALVVDIPKNGAHDPLQNSRPPACSRDLFCQLPCASASLTLFGVALRRYGKKWAAATEMQQALLRFSAGTSPPMGEPGGAVWRVGCKEK